MTKPLESMTWEEMVNECAELILKELMVGKFRTGVFLAVTVALRWKEHQDA